MRAILIAAGESQVVLRGAFSMVSGADAEQDCVQILFLTALDKFDLIAFRCVNEGNSTAVRGMWSV